MNNFICGDSLIKLKKIQEESVDFIITSPPYADQIKDYGEKAKKLKPDEFIDWFVQIAKELYRVLKPDGSFVLNINDKTDGKYQSIFVFKLVVTLCEEIGFHLVRDYIWYNPATPPNIFSRGTMGRTKKSHEYCFWFSKSENWTFNIDPIRKPYGIRMKRFLNGETHGNRAENTRPSRHSFNLDEKWKNNGGSDPGSVIVLSNTSSNDLFQKTCKELNIKHPARFPEKLAEFFILSGTNEGDVILDPFAGSGTTGIVAYKNNRKWICIDINPDYCKLARQWLQATKKRGKNSSQR